MRKAPIADFFNMVQLETSGAEVSRAALASSLTVRDVAAGHVYSNTLKVLEATGETLRRALEQCAGYFLVDEEKRVRISPHFPEPKEAHCNDDYFSSHETVSLPERYPYHVFLPECD